MFVDYEAESFYRFAMSLFMEAGHVFTSDPEYFNHSSERFVYFDNQSDVSLSPFDRAQLKRINNVSRLFTANGCAFFSINLFTIRSDRSELAHYIHTLIHPMIDQEGTICIFRFEDEVMLSFMGFGYHCILSDWYPMFDPYDQLLQRLDIINMKIDSDLEYFDDFVCTLARGYYVVSDNASPLTLLPVNIFMRYDRDEISREELDELIREGIASVFEAYGDDYVEYNETAAVRRVNIGSDLDMMLLDISMNDDETSDDNPFGETIDGDDSDYDDEDSDNHDEYEYGDLNPEVFKDPTLLVKLLQKQEQNRNELLN